MDKKLAILVDVLANKGGVERMMLDLAKHYKADIYAGVFTPEATFPGFKDVNVITLIKDRLPGPLNTLYLGQRFSRLRLAKKYDCFIMCGTGSLNAARHNRPNVWYCTAPSRYLYDLHEHEMGFHKGIRKVAYKVFTGMLRKTDQKNVRSVDRIISISQNSHDRVMKYYGRESEIIFPFVDVKKYQYIDTGDFYLSAARLDRIKRIDLIIEAFKEMPDKKLVIVSDGPEKQCLMRLAGDHKNITFLGYVSEEKLKELYGTCIATIYLSYKEDFGLIPVEGMAAGKPCIATNDGGFRETITHKKTGYLVDHPEDKKEVIAAVKWLDKEQSLKMCHDCEKHAKGFSSELLLKKIDKVVYSVLE